MVNETLTQVKRKIEKSESLKEETRKELLDLLSSLQVEIEQLYTTDPDHAESIAAFAQASALEAIRKEKKAHLSKLSLEGLAASVHGFENSHRRLVETVNSICVALSNLGI